MIAKGFSEELVIAGFGGQGVLLVGKLLVQTAMKAGYEVTFMPSYGAEVRGGTANCMVVMADEPVACPLVSEPDSLIAMNTASLEKFALRVRSGGLVVLNSSLIDAEPGRDDVTVVAVPADDIAVEAGSAKSANMAALGAYLARRGLIDPEAAIACLPEVLAARYHSLIPVNAEAIRTGAQHAKEHAGM